MIKRGHNASSRPVRAAAGVTGRPEHECESLFLEKSILIRIEPAFAQYKDARDTFLLALNQVLRFCPNVGLLVPSEFPDLLQQSVHLATAVHGSGECIRVITSEREAVKFDAIINVGTHVSNDLPWITVNSSGWVARVVSAH